MRYYNPESEDYQAELKEKLVEPWQEDLLKINPDYVFWGIHEDYMSGGKGWNSPLEADSWSDMTLDLDELNEVVNFYFELHRESKDCPDCNNGWSDRAWELNQSFYDRSDMAWTNNLCQEAVNILWNRKNSSVRRQFPDEIPTADEVNQWNKDSDRLFGGIDKYEAVTAQCEVEGVDTTCQSCNGRAFHYVGDKCEVSLTLWILHPRKGCSRGFEIRNIEQKDLPEIYKFLNEAAERNANRFSRIPTQ